MVGGGQAGLAAGYYLSKLGANYLIVDDGRRVGDPWRGRWASLRLFTPARINGLPGIIVDAPEGPVQTAAFEIEGGVIRALYVVRNPDKLRHLAPKRHETAPG